MTWLRWDVETPTSDVVGYLATALGCGTAQALGHYFACCSGFGQHRPDGRVAEVTDVTLEHWAIWTGRKGVFAKAFRTRCVGTDGLVRGWWRNLANIRKQVSDAHKPDGRKGKNRTESPETPDRDSRGIHGGNETTTATTTPSGSTIRETVVVEADAAALAITRELNRGLGDNPNIGRTLNPVIASAGTQVVADWLRAGITVEFACEQVYRIGKTYSSEGQISSLRYCDQGVRKAWSAAHSRPAHGSAHPASKPPVTKLRRV